MAIADDRTKAVELALAQIEKQFGKGSIVRLGSKEALLPIAVISTGSISFDAALGVGGIPRGRVTEVFGPESSGKTTITLQIIAEAQRNGGLAAFVDAEHALDPGYAKKLGVDVDNLLVSQPDSGEQALEITEALVKSGAIDVLVLDSVAALVPKAELDGEMGDSHMGLQARLMSQACASSPARVSKSRTALIFINQIREKIGVMFGNPETTTGGRALKFYSSVRVDIRRIAAIKEGDVVTGNADQGKDRQEQGGRAVPRGGVRHSLRRRHQQRGRRAGPGRGQQHCREVRRLVQLLRRAHRPGPRKHPRFSQGKQRTVRQDGRRAPQEAEHRSGQSRRA
jgi:recombination protein RecA